MKQIILLGLLVLSFIGCTKYNQIDTGLAQKKYPGNMYEYLHSDSYNWDSLLVFIDYLGLEDYFTGKKAGYEAVSYTHLDVYERQAGDVGREKCWCDGIV